MKLFAKIVGNGAPVMILHGLLGMGDNWLTVAKALSDQYRIHLVDQRNHGRSPHDSEMNYAAMADDLAEFIRDYRMEAPTVIGHSMGGKAAMTFALIYPELAKKLVVVDIAPRPYESPFFINIFNALGRLNLEVATSRADIDEQLGKSVPEAGIRMFLLKNLKRDLESGSFGWKMNLDALQENIDSLSAGLPVKGTYTKPVLFMRGGNSDYITSDDTEGIRTYFPAARITTVDNAGHWVHAENPARTIELLRQFLSE